MLSLAIISCTKNGENGLEGPEGTEQGGELGNESGMRWGITKTADETINGLRLILTFNPVTLTFSGTLENTNTSLVPMTRVEVHVFDAANKSTEFGPTPPVDMKPGEIRNINLIITSGLNPIEYNMHPEFGNASSGG